MLNRTGARLGRQAARLVASSGRCAIAPGLTKAEFDRIEAAFGIEFSDDHREFLAAGLPLDLPANAADRVTGWPDWRYGNPESLRARLRWPVEGVLFDVEHNVFWDETWGPRPSRTADALAEARGHLAHVPVMVPVCSHRYLPAGRGDWGHPVLSMYQTDIIIYGGDLTAYLHKELGIRNPNPGTEPHPTVEFWRDLVS